MSLISFYRGDAPDNKGRMISEIWEWSDDQLELCHDYIQWVFPLPEPSQFNPWAPLLQETDLVEFKSDLRLQLNLLKSFTRMLEFYGLDWRMTDDRDVIIEKGENYLEKKVQWQNPGNHNHLRITRIIRCLSLLNCDKCAKSFKAFLDELVVEEPQLFMPETVNFWTEAVV